MGFEPQYLMIKKFSHWSVYLHEDQTNLGRSYLWSNRQEYIDFLDMDREEQDEFFRVAKLLRQALTTLFQPDLFNYAALANAIKHLHVHVIPRYADKRVFEGVIFSDARWGHSYRTDPNFSVTDAMVLKIREAIQAELDT